MINARISLITAILLGASASPAFAKPAPWPKLGVETQINFPNFGAINNFEADGDRGIWFEDRNRRWYYAELFGPCHGLNFVQTIGFDTRGSASFDKFSSIIVEGQDCKLATLVTAEKPLSRKERMKLAKAAKKPLN
jgi:hypothetical protein